MGAAVPAQILGLRGQVVNAVTVGGEGVIRVSCRRDARRRPIDPRTGQRGRAHRWRRRTVWDVPMAGHRVALDIEYLEIAVGARDRRVEHLDFVAPGQGGLAGAQAHRHRRDLDQEAPHLPHRGQRSRSGPADRVRRRGSLRGQHGAVLRLAGREEEPPDPAGADGHVEAVSQGHAGPRAAGGDSVRQVPRHAPSGRGTRPGAQGRVRAAGR